MGEEEENGKDEGDGNGEEGSFVSARNRQKN